MNTQHFKTVIARSGTRTFIPIPFNPNGVLLFTCGGTTGPEEISGGFQGETFDYSTLGVNEFLRLLVEYSCTCRHLEYDQYPENHVYIIAQKTQ